MKKKNRKTLLDQSLENLESLNIIWSKCSLKSPCKTTALSWRHLHPVSPTPEKAGATGGDGLAQGLIPPGYRWGLLTPHSVADFPCQWLPRATLSFLMLSHQKVNFQGGKPVKIFFKKREKQLPYPSLPGQFSSVTCACLSHLGRHVP